MGRERERDVYRVESMGGWMDERMCVRTIFHSDFYDSRNIFLNKN